MKHKELHNLVKLILNEVSYQLSNIGVASKNAKSGRRFIPKQIKVPVSLFEDPKIKPHVKFLSSGSKTIMFVSPVFKVALDQLERGRSSHEKEEKKPELTRRISELFDRINMGASVRGKLKKSINPKLDPNIKMHRVDMDIDKKGNDWIVQMMNEDLLLEDFING